MASAVEFIRNAPLGARMTVRTRLEAEPSGALFTDAVGYLRQRDDLECVVETRHGLVTIPLRKVIAAKAVPPPPQRRAPRFPPIG